MAGLEIGFGEDGKLDAGFLRLPVPQGNYQDPI
jgi:hypothetical protein